MFVYHVIRWRYKGVCGVSDYLRLVGNIPSLLFIAIKLVEKCQEHLKLCITKLVQQSTHGTNEIFYDPKKNKYSIRKDLMRHAFSKSNFNLQNFSTLLLFQYKYGHAIHVCRVKFKMEYWDVPGLQGCRVRTECLQYVKYNIIYKI